MTKAEVEQIKKRASELSYQHFEALALLRKLCAGYEKSMEALELATHQYPMIPWISKLLREWNGDK